MATRDTAPRRKPIYQEVDERDSRRVSTKVRNSRKRRSQSLHSRYAVPYDIDGPRVRLGVLWFAVAVAALALGPLPAALVYGGAAATAAAQTARGWRKRGERPTELVAAAMAALMTAGACLGAGGAGLGLLAGVVLALVAAAGDVKSPNATVADAGWTIQCALFPGLVGLSMVLLTRLDQGSAIALLLLASAYETGDYLIGSGARNPYEGPLAGMSAIVVVTFIVSTMPISTLGFGEAWLFGAVVAIGAPLGQLFASALLPAAGAPASALRRLDSLLLVAPAWSWGVGLVI